MSKVQELWAGLRRWKYLPITLVVFSYLLVSAYYMAPSFAHCKDTLYGFGDNTAGPIWTYKATDGAFMPHRTEASNYPEGENLFSAVSLTSLGQRMVFWPLSQITGPVCGYNLMNIVGFVSTALVMFGFVYWLIRNKWLAWLAGYAAAFAPYMQLRVGTGPSYAYSGILIGIFWLLIALIKQPTRYKAVGLGVLVSFCVYFDPYFVLYGTLTGLSVLLAWLLSIAVRLVRRKKAALFSELPASRVVLKHLSISAIVAVILLAPFAAITILARHDIQKQVSSVRGNVLYETIACSNYPHEYLLPFVLHPVPKVLGIEDAYKKAEIQLKNNFSCGIGEDTVGVSLTLLFVVSVTGGLLVWERVNRRRLISSVPKGIKLGHFVLLSTGLLLVIGITFGLPPTKIFGIPTPMHVLFEFTTTWRTLARIFMLVNLALVVFASAALYFYTRNKNISRRLKLIGYIVILLAVFVEYQAFPAFKGNTLYTFSYKKDTPPVYNWLKTQDNIQAVAEYPMESYGESDAPTYYLSMQFVHDKQILNSPSPNSSMEVFRRSIKNINDPQTLPALRALGIDAVVVHGVNEAFVNKYSSMKVSDVFSQPFHGLFNHTGILKGDKSVVLSTGEGQTKDALVGLLSSGFYRNLGIIDYPKEWAYEAVQGAKIELRQVSGGKINTNSVPQNYCFDIRASAPGQTLVFQPVIDGVRAQGITITNSYSPFKVAAKDSIVLMNDSGSNMQITKLGCARE